MSRKQKQHNCKCCNFVTLKAGLLKNVNAGTSFKGDTEGKSTTIQNYAKERLAPYTEEGQICMRLLCTIMISLFESQIKLMLFYENISYQNQIRKRQKT